MRTIVMAVIRIYRNYLSRLKLRTCRFYPSCSEYAMEAVEKFGVWKGLLKTIGRITKCHPFHPGGYDPVVND